MDAMLGLVCDWHSDACGSFTLGASRGARPVTPGVAGRGPRSIATPPHLFGTAATMIQQCFSLLFNSFLFV